MSQRSAAAPEHLSGAANRLKLGTVRAGIALGSRLLPGTTVERAARLFVTPFSSSRRDALAARPDADMQRGEQVIGGQRIATYTWGDPTRQPYALLVHGWSSGGLRFLSWVAHLRALGLAVVTFDQPGHGFSSGRTCTLPDFVDTTNEIGRQLGPAALAIGHSMGGAAVVLAQDQAWQAHRLVLLAPAVDWNAAADRFFRLVRLPPRLHTRFVAWHEGYTGIHPDKMQVHLHLAAVGQPGLVIHDLHDGEVPWSEGERYVRHWPSARLLSTEGLGHHDIVDAPTVIDATLRFLRGDPVGERVVGSPDLP